MLNIPLTKSFIIECASKCVYTYTRIDIYMEKSGHITHQVLHNANNNISTN